MKYTDEKLLSTKFSLDYLSSPTIGFIVETETGKNTIGVYIPKLMSKFDMSKGAKKETITLKRNKIKNTKNKNIGSITIDKRNYIEMPILVNGNIGNNLHVKGEKCFLEFADEDINSITIRPYGTFETPRRSVDRVTVFAPASGKEKTPINEKNSYYIDCNSDAGTINIHMSNTNGEVSEYDISIDGNSGSILLTDGKRTVGILTDSDVISGQNESGSYFTAKGNTFKANADMVEINANTKLSINTPNMELNADSLKIIGKNKNEEFTSIKQSASSLNQKLDKIITDSKIEEHISNMVKFDTTTFGIKGSLCPEDIAFGITVRFSSTSD